MNKPLAALLCASLSVLAADAAARRIGPRRPPVQPVGERGMIDAVAISTDGRAALSRDDQGNVQFWATLDGETEPQPVDVHSPESMALAPRGAGFTLTIVDTAGGGHVLRAGADGTSRETATISPTDPVSLLRPIPGEGRVLAVAADSTLRLYGETGKPLGKLEERDFRPTELCVAADGKSALVVIEGESLQKLTIGKKKIALLGEAARLPAVAGGTRLGGACSPAADRYAFLRTGALSTGDIELVVVGIDGTEIASQKIGAQYGVSDLGFLDDGALLLWAPSSSLSAWKYDLKKKDLVARPGRPDAMLTTPKEVVAGGRLLSGDGTWLFVQDIDAREQRYLGYDDFVPFMVAMSPSGVAAFADGVGNILVEDIAGEERRFLPAKPNGVGVVGIYFVDDEHLLAADGSGIMRLVAWRTRKVVERVWTGFLGDAQYEPSTRLFRMSNGNGETRVWEVGGKGFTGPYVIADGGFSSGLIAADKASEPALWTLDGGNVRREYTLAEIRGDLSLEEMTSRGKQPDPGEDFPLFVDGKGRKYFAVAGGTGTNIEIRQGDKTQTIRTDLIEVAMIVPSADGSVVAAADSAGALAVYRPGERGALWTWSDPAGMGSVPVWSADGKWLALAGSGGAVVLDGKTGDVAYRRRVLGFEEKQVLEFPAQFMGGMRGFPGPGDPGIIDF